MKLKKITLFLLGSILLVFITYVIVNYNHWAFPKGYTDKTIKEIDLSGNSVKSALKYAKLRTDEWHEGGVLFGAIMHFSDKKSLQRMKGDFSCFYQIINRSSLFGLKYVVSITDIDFKTEEVTLFTVSSDDRGSEDNNITEDEISKWTIDIDDAFKAMEDLVGTDYLDKFDTPIGKLLFSADNWILTIEDIYSKKSVEIEINPVNGIAQLYHNDFSS